MKNFENQTTLDKNIKKALNVCTLAVEVCPWIPKENIGFRYNTLKGLEYWLF